MSRRRRTILAAVCSGLVVIGAATCWRLSPWYPSQVHGPVRLQWHSTGEPRQVEGFVRDAAGRPIPEISVDVEDPDGTTHLVTDGNGRFELEIPELVGLDVGSKARFEWPLVLGVSCADGLRLNITVNE